MKGRFQAGDWVRGALCSKHLLAKMQRGGGSGRKGSSQGRASLSQHRSRVFVGVAIAIVVDMRVSPFLQAELESVRSAAASREVELKFEIDRARQGRKELEARFAGLDPHKMAHEDQALAQASQVSAEGDGGGQHPHGTPHSEALSTVSKVAPRDRSDMDLRSRTVRPSAAWAVQGGTIGALPHT